MEPLRIGLIAALVVALAAAGWLYTENQRLRGALDALTTVTSARPASRAPRAAQAQRAATASDSSTAADRVVSAQQRDALVGRLSQTVDPDSEVWFVTDRGNPEADAYRQELEETFALAGWRVGNNTVSRSRLKPGLFAYIGDAEPPGYIDAALEAFQLAGIELATGVQYRDYYEQRRKDEPSWQGLELAPDQSWVVVIGRKGTRP